MGPEVFVALADDGAGTAYGAAASAAPGRGGDVCANGCSVRRMDVATRLPLSSATLSAPVARFVAARFAPDMRRFVIGYLLPGSSMGSYAGYRIETFSVE